MELKCRIIIPYGRPNVVPKDKSTCGKPRQEDKSIQITFTKALAFGSRNSSEINMSFKGSKCIYEVQQQALEIRHCIHVDISKFHLKEVSILCFFEISLPSPQID